MVGRFYTQKYYENCRIYEYAGNSRGSDSWRQHGACTTAFAAAKPGENNHRWHAPGDG
jgi:hypothetical protein